MNVLEKYMKAKSKRQSKERDSTILAIRKERLWMREQLMKDGYTYVVHQRNAAYFNKLGFKFDGVVTTDMAYNAPMTVTAQVVRVP